MKMLRTLRFTASSVVGFGGWCLIASQREAEAKSQTADCNNLQVWPPRHNLEEPAGENRLNLSASLRHTWGSFRLEEVLPINYNTSKFVFSFSDPNARYDLPSSATIEIRLNARNGKPVSRLYTPLTSRGSKGGFEIVSRCYEHGSFTPYLHNLKEGSEIMGRFAQTYNCESSSKHTHVACITCGPGIAPALQVCRNALENGVKKPSVTLLYSNRSQPDILLKHELDQLQGKHPGRFKVVYLLEYPPVGWDGETGLITAELLARTLPPPTRFLPASSETGIYLACPSKLMYYLDGRRFFPSARFNDTGEIDHPRFTSTYTADKHKGLLHYMGFDDHELHRHPCR